MASDLYDLSNRVVGIMGSDEDTTAAIHGLRVEGLHFDLLAGERGKDRILPDADDGLLAPFIEALRSFGDQTRVLDRLEEALDRGGCVLAVEFDSEEEAETAARILDEHGGRDLWRLGEWTQARLGGEDQG